MNIHVLKVNSLLIPRGLYTDWMGNALSDVNANQLISEGAAILTNIADPIPPLTGGSSLIAAKSSTSALGDSLIAYGLPQSGGVLSSGTYSNSEIAWYNDLAMAYGLTGFDIVNCYAIGGRTLEEILAVQVPLAAADTNECAIVRGGINNLNSTLSNNDAVQTIISVMEQIILGLASKKIIVICSINPIYQSGSTGAKVRAYLIPLINAGLQSMCKKYSNVIWNDTYSAMVDPSSAALDALPNLLRSDDGIHFTSSGAQVSGYAMFNNIAKKVNLTRYKTKGANLVQDVWGTTGGTNTPGSGTITNPGNIPAGWNVQVASGNAAVTVTPLAPNMIRLAITNAGASASVIYLKTTNTTGLAALVAKGDIIQSGFEFQVSGNSGLNRLAATNRINGTAQMYGMFEPNTTEEPTITYPQKSGSGKRLTPPRLLDVDITSLEFFVAIKVAASTGASIIDIGNPELYKLT
ncbi:lysophospholipase L1-like esterase [Methylovorus glucosotrophus]|uniref:SGNH/GDSL hydrolase family protein n=1 Tax=Methylovorus glucosotrophus TaxID=266009 RepID=UPI0013312BDA|nr:SGNH/GDSL hydrolase family protein [Methylovorus glucosotrophus]KAF0844335.1 lysophospholipase L1-like esterase [Methylovorus glucosotrophus]